MVAELYERARPDYPDEAVEWLVDRLGLAPGRTIVDVAAGTGKLTRHLVGRGARVVAVEPLAEMRAPIARTAPGAEVLSGTAEELPLPDGSADAATVGQAFHWFDAERASAELARVLRPGGVLAPVWNKRDTADPLQQRLDELLRPYRRDTPSEREQPWRAVLAASPAFGEEELRSFPFEEPSTGDGLVDRIASVSFVARLDPPERDELLARVRDAAGGLREPFPVRYRTDVYVYPRV